MKLDFGCGPNKREGFTGVDCRQFQKDGVDKVDVVLNLVAKEDDIIPSEAQPGYGIRVFDGKFKKWPWANNEVSEVHASHFVEHLKQMERVHFVNELYRVMIPGAKATIIVPHWASCRAYGDMTHEWPPVSEFWFYYLDKEWRAANAPHNDFYTCNFHSSWGYNLHGDLGVRNQEMQAFAANNYKEACQDIVATLTKKLEKLEK
jgi:hypothetical protein